MTTTNTPAALYCVVYRTGGTANFTWHRSLAMSHADARRVCAETRQAGYRAIVVDYRRSLAIGLPETYE